MVEMEVALVVLPLGLGRGAACKSAHSSTRYRSLATFIGSNRRRQCGLPGHTCVQDRARRRVYGTREGGSM
jgi:hypothetical protein